MTLRHAVVFPRSGQLTLRGYAAPAITCLLFQPSYFGIEDQEVPHYKCHDDGEPDGDVALPREEGQETAAATLDNNIGLSNTVTNQRGEGGLPFLPSLYRRSNDYR